MSIKQGQKQIKTVRCPYIPEHIMPQQSLLNHLSRCTATNKHLFTKCRYNPLHVYPNTLIDQHYQKCKDRKKYQEKVGESSDDWDSDSGKKQESPKIIEKIAPRQGNRTSNKNNKKELNQSTIKRINFDDSDDQSWDPIISQLNQKPNNIKNTNASILKTFRGKRNQQENVQSDKKTKENSKNLSFEQKSTLKENKNTSFKQQNSKIMNKKQQISDQRILISLDSQSFSQKEGEINLKQSSNSNEKSCETLKSYSDKSKNGDNKKNTSKKLSKSIFDQNLEVEDF